MSVALVMIKLDRLILGMLLSLHKHATLEWTLQHTVFSILGNMHICIIDDWNYFHAYFLIVKLESADC